MPISSERVLPVLIATRAERESDRVYLEEVGGPSYTYGELHREVRQWVSRWTSLGVKAGETVLVMLPNSANAVAAWLALGWIGAIEVPVNTAYKGNMLRYVIRDSRARVMLVDSHYLPVLADLSAAGEADIGALQQVVVAGEAAGGFGRGRLTLTAVSELELEGQQPLSPPGPSDIATILYTSGTTGPSKGVLVPWAQIYATSTGSLPLDSLSADDAYYSAFPLFHISGKGPVSSMALVGARLVMRGRFDTAAFWSDITTYRCTTTLLLGAMANFIFQQPPQSGDPHTPLRNVAMIPLIPEVEEFQKRFSVRVATAYNMTEISCPIVSNGWELVDNKSCGRLRDGYQARVVDEDDDEVPVGSVGELIIRSEAPWTLMAGYWGMPEKTVEAWRNQWVHTGDAFYRSESGDYYFVDRRKDAIRRRGENISSMEVEAEVNTHPCVLESAAVAVPSEWGEDEVKVIVVEQPGCNLTPEELWAYLDQRLPKFMVPRYIELSVQLPKTPTEKIQKAALRAEGLTDATWDQKRAGSQSASGAIEGYQRES